MQTLAKMGAFLKHFAYHFTSDQDNIGVWGFVYLHYSDHEHHDDDHAEHENLPFQHHHHGDQLRLVQSTFLLLQPPQTITLWSAGDSYNTLIPTHPQWRSSSFLDNIWQPPKA